MGFKKWLIMFLQMLQSKMFSIDFGGN